MQVSLGDQILPQRKHTQHEPSYVMPTLGTQRDRRERFYANSLVSMHTIEWGSIYIIEKGIKGGHDDGAFPEGESSLVTVFAWHRQEM